MNWWWVRHAPTHARAAIGWTDLPADLSDESALDRLKRSLPDAPVVSSDLARARATADRIVGARARLPEQPGLRELSFGAWEGLDFDAIAARWPDASRAFFETPGPAAPPGGESFDMLRARVAAVIARLDRGQGDIVAVAHAGVIQAALAIAADLTPAQALRFVIAPLSVTRLDWLPDARAWRIGAVNGC